MKVATVLYFIYLNLDNSWPLFMILKHKGIISVYIRKCMALELSPLTSAPITPKDVTLRFSKGFDLLVELRNGYKNIGILANLFYNTI